MITNCRRNCREHRIYPLVKIGDHCRASETAALNQVMLGEENNIKDVDQIKYNIPAKRKYEL